MNENFIGKKIAELRKSKKMTQKELAEKLFVTNKTVSRWELGNSEPEIDQIVKLSEIFCIDINQLIGSESPMPVAEDSVVVRQKADVRKIVFYTVTPLIAAAVLIISLCLTLVKGGYVVTDKFEAEWATLRALDQSLDGEGLVESSPFASNGHCIAVFGIKNNNITFTINSSKATKAKLYIAVVSRLIEQDEAHYIETDFDTVWNLYVNPTEEQLKAKEYVKVNCWYISNDITKLWYDFVEVPVDIELKKGENVIKFIVPTTGSGLYGLNMDYIRIDTDAKLSWKPETENVVRPPDELIVRDEEIHAYAMYKA